MYIDVVRIDEAVPSTGLDKETIGRVEKLLDTEILRNPFEAYKRRFEELVNALKTTFYEADQPLQEEDRQQLERFIDHFSRFPEWLEHIQSRYSADAE